MATIKGNGVSRGLASGLAHWSGRGECSPGSVLLAQMTTTDDLPDMVKCVAIVTVRGGMLCHAAIVARELGIPAVVGVGESLLVLKEGQALTVDGLKGTIGYV